MFVPCGKRTRRRGRRPARRNWMNAASAGHVEAGSGRHAGEWARNGPGPWNDPRPRPDTCYGEKETVSGISEMPLYLSIASFIRLSLWPRRLFHSAHQLRKFLKVGSGSERMPK